MNKPYLSRLNLQYFAADGGGEFGAYDPGTAFEGIEPTPAPEGAPAAPPIQDPTQQPEPQAQPQPEVLDFGGRKIPALNEDLTGLHKDYTEQQRYITALQEQVKAYQQIAQMQPQSQPPAPQQAQTPPMNEWTEETWQQFYDKPTEVINNMVQQEIQKALAEKVDPILQEREWNAEINRMYEQFPDFENLIGDVQQLVTQYPDRYADRQGGLEEAYYRAKATQASQIQPAQVAQNPQVQQQVMQNYFEQKQQINAQTPTTMGRGGGFTPQTPVNSPTTLKEASRQFMKTMGYR